jgi:hypothetical protein
VNHPATHRVNIGAGSKRRSRRVVRWALRCSCLLLGTLVSVDSGADSGVPLSLQVRLLAHLGTYDRHFKDRAGPMANVLVVQRKGDTKSSFERVGLVRSLADIRELGGVPIHVEAIEFTDADALARRCRKDRIAVLYLTVGLEADMPRLAAALVSGDILTVGTSARHAENGAVVGFALEEARPRLIINLPQARAQNVDWRSEVLVLAKLIKQIGPFVGRASVVVDADVQSARGTTWASDEARRALGLARRVVRRFTSAGG